MEDDVGFREFVEARLVRLSRVAYLLTGRHHDAEDLLQAALVKVAARWRRVAATGDPEAYVRRVMYNERILSWRRWRRQVVQPAEGVPEVGPTGDAADGVVSRLVLERALARLTWRQRAVLVLRFFEDLSVAETAAVLGCSIGTVKSQTSHALGRLRTLAPELADLMSEPMEVADERVEGHAR
ncbi:SigE family RNA polymerase sigma factor [Plantactinospora sp. KLBMP9567]|uniref:SigE family RNA polymerase sigma factor n=1 Tax=Plantactinospora sp. KLBMP9567 TaxID=3085900 RepID=UPI002980B065|nr:SigE family RNA polymerase sigma factor [Plantactinospora sp. KLBMP9567]MDW5328462.1 SigE family RNA polymerase sigma factor [Plantactinospora sp. KLBMP9567]